MRGYYYRAHDEAGRKRTGTIEAFDRHSATAILRRNGLRPYFLFDYHVVKKVAQRRKKRERILIALGAVLILASFPISTYMVRRAERERPPDVEEYARTGILTGASGIIAAKGEQERAFAQDVYDAWETYSPGMVTGVEVTHFLMSVYVNEKVRDVSDEDLEQLAVSTVKAHHRQLGSKAVQLLVVEGDTTIMEVEYNVLSGTPHVESYR